MSRKDIRGGEFKITPIGLLVRENGTKYGGAIARAAARFIRRILQVTFCRRLPYDMRSSLKGLGAAPGNEQQPGAECSELEEGQVFEP
jgi:hypothetical protein